MLEHVLVVGEQVLAKAQTMDSYHYFVPTMYIHGRHNAKQSIKLEEWMGKRKKNE